MNCLLRINKVLVTFWLTDCTLVHLDYEPCWPVRDTGQHKEILHILKSSLLWHNWWSHTCIYTTGEFICCQQALVFICFSFKASKKIAWPKTLVQEKRLRESSSPRFRLVPKSFVKSNHIQTIKAKWFSVERVKSNSINQLRRDISLDKWLHIVLDNEK